MSYDEQFKAAVEMLAKEQGVSVSQIDANLDSPEVAKLLLDTIDVIEGDVMSLILKSPEFGGAYAQITGTFTRELDMRPTDVKKLVTRDKAIIALVITFLGRI